MKSVHLITIQRQSALSIKIIAVILLLAHPLFCFSKPMPDGQTSKPATKFQQVNADSLKIEELAALAFHFYDNQGDKQLADSAGQKAIELAEASYQPALLLLAYIRYLENNDISAYLTKSQNYAQEAVTMSKLVNNPKLEWQALRSAVKVNIAAYKYDKALAISYQALALADAMQNDEYKAESYLLIGQSLEGNNQKIEAFRNYLTTSSIAEKLQNVSLLKKCYSLLSGFYNNNKIYNKAIHYKLKEVDVILKSLPVDSVRLLWAKYDLQVIDVNSNNNKLNTKSIHEILDFAVRNNHPRLKNYEIALYRSHLVAADKISQLAEFYTLQFPEEFNRLSIEYPALYYRLKAYFNENEGRDDSAFFYLNKAEQLIKSDPNKIMQSNFYQRYGQFLVRQGEQKSAISKFLKSYELAREASYFEYMLSASKNIETLYASMGDYKNAFIYSGLNRALADSISKFTQNDQLLMLEIDHETKQLERLTELNEIETHRRHNIQYMAITIVIIAMFILLIMLGSLTIPTWVIKVLGFFSFILLFEFIIMIADHKIYEITHNEPWKILLIKIGLIAFLLPFHHWIEKRVIHYLINNKLLKLPTFSLQRIWSKVPKPKTES